MFLLWRIPLIWKSSKNPIFVDYVGNQKYNDPYNNTYNLGCCNHANFSYCNNQCHLKPQAPQVPYSFSTPNIVVASHRNNQLESFFKSFIQKTNNQVQPQGVSIKALETHMWHISPVSSFGTKSVITCKAISWRCGKILWRTMWKKINIRINKRRTRGSLKDLLGESYIQERTFLGWERKW